MPPFGQRQRGARHAAAGAWVEIYFAGFGWLPFDPTRHNDAGGTLLRRPGRLPAPSPFADVRRRFPRLRRTSTQPTPTPSPEPDSTPTPEPDALPDTPTPAPPATPEPPRDHLRLWPLLLLPLLALLAAEAVSAPPRRSPSGRKTPTTRCWCGRAAEALLCMGIALPGEAPASFCARKANYTMR
ncbi:MAG: hypothetical protein ACLUI3_04795 [Christensenellales bacterium]